MPPVTSHNTRGGVAPWVDYVIPKLMELRRHSGSKVASIVRRMESAVMTKSATPLRDRLKRARELAKGLTREDREWLLNFLNPNRRP